MLSLGPSAHRYIPPVCIGWTRICGKRKLQGRKIPETRVLMTIVAPPLEMMTPKKTGGRPDGALPSCGIDDERKKWDGGLRHPIKIVPARSRMLG